MSIARIRRSKEVLPTVTRAVGIVLIIGEAE